MARKKLIETTEPVEAPEEAAEDVLPPLDNTGETLAVGQVTVSWDTPRHLWDALGHISFSLAVPTEDVVGAAVYVADLGHGIIEALEERYGDIIAASAKDRSNGSGGGSYRNSGPVVLKGLTDEQRDEFVEDLLGPLAEELGIESQNPVAVFIETAKASGLYMAQVKPGSEDGELFMEFARALADGEDPDPVVEPKKTKRGRGSAARRTADRARSTRRRSPFRR